MWLDVVCAVSVFVNGAVDVAYTPCYYSLLLWVVTLTQRDDVDGKFVVEIIIVGIA